DHQSLLLHSESFAVARQLALSEASSHPTQRSCRNDQLVPTSGPQTKYPPARSPSLRPVLRNLALHTPRPPELVMLSDLPYHSASAAAFPSVHTPPEPYIQAVSGPDIGAFVPLLLSLHSPDPLLLGRYSRPPGVYLHLHLRAPPQPLLPPRRLLPVAPR